MHEAAKILTKRLEKLQAHTSALSDYKLLIDEMLTRKDIFDPRIFTRLSASEKAYLDAYLKRFSAIQDFLGAKIFPLLLEVAGIGVSRMSEVLFMIEKEGIIDSFEQWVELREIRNALEHDYPDNLEEALEDLRYCVEHFSTIDTYCKNVMRFSTRFLS